MYCLDGLLYLLAHLPKKVFSGMSTTSTPPPQAGQTDVQNSTFFTRSESVTLNSDEEVKRSNDQFFREEGVGFSHPVESYPLAKQPHLLQPYAQREQLFGGGAGEGVNSERDKGATTEKKLLPVSYSRTESRYAHWST